MDVLLTREERTAIQRNYKLWLDNLNPVEFGVKLYTEGILSTREREKLEAKKTVYEKNEFLYEAALQRCSYDGLRIVKQALIDTDQVHIAKKLPVRPGDRFWQIYEEKQRAKSAGTPMDTSSSHQMHFQGQPSQSQPLHAHPGPPQPGMNQPPPPFPQNVPPFPQNAPPFPQNAPPFAHNAARHDEPQYQQVPPLPCYKPKESNDNKKGKGYCLIIANYTNHLKGYQVDIRQITNFFRDELNYTVRTEQNVKRSRMLSILQETRSFLVVNEDFDRLFVFILSHGEKEGIQTCQANGFDDEREGGVKQYVTQEEIVSLFRHSSLPTLRDYPKAFFFQVCRGKEIAQAAGGDSAEDDMEIAQPAASATEIAIAADTLVCHASRIGHFSWVDNTKGSWFVEVIMNVFRRHYTTEHLVDMMTQVNKEIAMKTQPSLINGDIQKVYQIPCIRHNLTRKLFLA